MAMSLPAAHNKPPLTASSSNLSDKPLDFSKSSPEIQRFVYYQQEALDDCSRRIVEQEVVKKTYLDLRTRLSTIAEQTRYPSIVPLGPHALVRGELIHTNEILVFLGDGYFVERTAKQAWEIADRRINSVNGNLQKFIEERNLIQSKLDMISTMIRQQGIDEDIVEIRETLDDHTAQKHPSERTANLPQKTPTDLEIAQRLDQLEKEEMEEDETSSTRQENSTQGSSEDMDSLMDTEIFLRPIPNLSDRPRRSSLPSVTPGKEKKERKNVTFAPFEGTVPERERSVNPMFKEALQKMLASGKFRTMDESSSEFEFDDPPPPRSISSDNVPRLKKQGHIAMDSIEDSLDVEPAGPSPVTDTDVIIERNLGEVSSDSQGESLLTSPSEESTKPVSRFKASRQREK